jgi:hypothetical protein
VIDTLYDEVEFTGTIVARVSDSKARSAYTTEIEHDDFEEDLSTLTLAAAAWARGSTGS